MAVFNPTTNTESEVVFKYNRSGSWYLEKLGNKSQRNNVDYEQEFAFDLWEHYLKPGPKEWIVLSLYLVVFIVSLIGNTLIVIYILKRKHLQTTVYYFMLNLSIADVLVTLIALPPTLIVDIFESWMFGHFMCKISPYLQMTVASVSTLSLGAIAVNRWFVVCHPLKASAVQSTTKAAVACIVAIWVFSLTTLCPVAVVSEVSQDYDIARFPELEPLKSCSEEWDSQTKRSVFHVYFFFLCYAVPLVVLSVTYIKVFQELRRVKIPGFHQRKHSKYAGNDCNCTNGKRTREVSIALKPMARNGIHSIPNSPTTPNQLQVNMWDNHEGLLEMESPDCIGEEQQGIDEDLEESAQSNNSFSKRLRKSLSRLSFRKSDSGSICYKCSSMMLLLRSRRRSAKMQVTLIIVFGICYAPNMTLDLMRTVFGYFNEGHRETTYFIHAIGHLIMYLNSALNPIIYNIFSGQFRKEFRKTFSCVFGHSLKRRTSAITSTFVLSKSDHSRGEALKSTERITEY